MRCSSLVGLKSSKYSSRATFETHTQDFLLGGADEQLGLREVWSRETLKFRLYENTDSLHFNDLISVCIITEFKINENLGRQFAAFDCLFL